VGGCPLSTARWTVGRSEAAEWIRGHDTARVSGCRGHGRAGLSKSAEDMGNQRTCGVCQDEDGTGRGCAGPGEFRVARVPGEFRVARVPGEFRVARVPGEIRVRCACAG
jgi:hypothetical protein